MNLNWDGLIPIAQVLEHVRPAYGGDTWDEALSYLHSEPSEATVIRELAANGPTGFREPIRIAFDEPDDPDDGFDPTPPDPFGREWYVSNGMHRIATAVSLGRTHILSTQYRPENDTVSSDADTEYIEMSYRILGEWPDDPEHDAMAHACNWLRSFPLADGTWVENGIFSGCGDQLEGLWYCPHSHQDALIAEMRRRVPDLVVDRVRCVTGGQLDAEYDAEAQARQAC